MVLGGFFLHFGFLTDFTDFTDFRGGAEQVIKRVIISLSEDTWRLRNQSVKSVKSVRDQITRCCLKINLCNL